ncbi:large ribosomal subunit protein uL4m-like isoform X2 [Apostichopus japonicus]|uniref:large ribosomal subunit protein uL4m-like isoform X2 n=1 Tax=Stichopus japonicus TaxID=307972 RepID=UPI003AB766F8
MFSRVLQRVCRQSYVNNQNVQYVLPVCRGCIASRFSSSEVADGSKDSATSPAFNHGSESLVLEREVACPPHLQKPQAWLESLETRESKKLAIVDLHPDVFGTFPRLDILHRNIEWQKVYKIIDVRKEKTRAECSGGGRKPWRQKGTGRARHGSIRSPIWLKGGKAHPPRGGRTYWYVLPAPIRAWGLRIAMSIKHAQDNLCIVDSLDIPSSDPQYLEDIAKERYWGESVLFVDDKPLEEMSENFMDAINKIKTYNIISTEGLNCYSLLKHETIVMTLDAVNFLELRLMFFTKQYGSPDLRQDLPILRSQLKMDPHRGRSYSSKE